MSTNNTVVLFLEAQPVTGGITMHSNVLVGDYLLVEPKSVLKIVTGFPC